MRIVSFCAHQPYLYLFKGMGLEFDLIEMVQHRRFLQNWNSGVRPLPQGWRLINWEQAKQNLQAGYYNLSLAHNASEYIDFCSYNVARVFIVHGTLSGRITEEQSSVDLDQYKQNLSSLVTQTKGTIVYISELKRKDWGLDGVVIPNAIDANDYEGYKGINPIILRVSNHLVERSLILNFPAHQKITNGFDVKLIGENPKIPEARPAKSWEELKQAYRNNRVYLHTVNPKHEDGYNLAMLEAMATGMPVITMDYESSPIVDSVNGFKSDDISYLREKIKLLMMDREFAVELGKTARETVLRDFSFEKFQERWLKLFNQKCP